MIEEGGRGKGSAVVSDKATRVSENSGAVVRRCYCIEMNAMNFHHTQDPVYL